MWGTLLPARRRGGGVYCIHSSVLSVIAFVPSLVHSCAHSFNDFFFFFINLSVHCFTPSVHDFVRWIRDLFVGFCYFVEGRRRYHGACLCVAAGENGRPCIGVAFVRSCLVCECDLIFFRSFMRSLIISPRVFHDSFFLLLLLGRGQTVLSWGALMSARRRDSGPTNGAAGLLLNASRSLFPLSVGSFARLLSSLVHSQVIWW